MTSLGTYVNIKCGLESSNFYTEELEVLLKSYTVMNYHSTYIAAHSGCDLALNPTITSLSAISKVLDS